MTSTAVFTFRRLHHVQLAIPAGSEDVGRKFYGETLGMTELPKPPALAARGGCWFDGGGVELHLGIDPDFSPSRKSHPAILVTGLHDLATQLEAVGTTVTWDRQMPGYDRFYATDPFGNRLEFLEPRPRSRP